MHLRTPLQKKLNAKCWLNPQKPDKVNERMSVHALLASAPLTTRFCNSRAAPVQPFAHPHYPVDLSARKAPGRRRRPRQQRQHRSERVSRDR